MDYICLENNTSVSTELQFFFKKKALMDLSTLSTSLALSLISGYLANGNSSTQHTFIKKKDDLLKPHIFTETDQLWQNHFLNSFLRVANKRLPAQPGWVPISCNVWDHWPQVPIRKMYHQKTRVWRNDGCVKPNAPSLKFSLKSSRLYIGDNLKREELQSGCFYDKMYRIFLSFKSAFEQ